jgi:hypothetical protein
MLWQLHGPRVADRPCSRPQFAENLRNTALYNKIVMVLRDNVEPTKHSICLPVDWSTN